MMLSSKNRRNKRSNGDDDSYSYHNSLPINKTTRRKKKRKKHSSSLFDPTVRRNTIIMWIIGVCTIEVYFFSSSITTLDELLREKSGHTIPMPKDPPPPKTHLLPKKVIAVFGPESSGTTFLSTTLGVAVGAFNEDGRWFHTPAWAFNHTINDDHNQGHRIIRQYNPKGKWTFEKEIQRRAMSLDGEWEIQHISLPWGWECEDGKNITIVEALVPEECFRYERDPHLHPKTAEKVYFATGGQRDGDSSSTHNNTEGNITEEEANVISMCRDEVKISQHNDGTCGGKCGTGRYDGYALYPERFSVNISSHIEWYLSRGVDIKVVLSRRDRTISSRGKLIGHCHLLDIGKKEDEVALSLMSEAIEKYGGTEHVIISSYEGIMAMEEAYLHVLYNQLGINSTYIPSFADGNTKYLVDVTAEKKEKQTTQQQHVSLEDRPPVMFGGQQSYVEPPPKQSLLPKRVITILGPESSGTKFLSSALAVAVNAYKSGGQWSYAPLPYENSSQSEQWVYHQYNYRRAMSPDGEFEIQHISLPWGWSCNDEQTMNTVEALVPEECFRYETDPDLRPESAERYWLMNEGSKKHNPTRKKRMHRPRFLEANGLPDAATLDAAVLERCRNELHILEDSMTSCGAKCGAGRYSGLALYPRRFFVNITSHIEWYQSRGVEITAILSMRDRAISKMGKLRDHCWVPERAEEEDALALSLMKEAMLKYGKSANSGGESPVVLPVSYEGLMQLKGVYLFDLYRKLRLKSSYLPTFRDGNEKYIRREEDYFPLLPKPKKKHMKKITLPNKVITVFGPESSGTTFLASTLGIAVGIFEVDGISRQATSPNGEWEIQHLSLPWGWQCEEDEDIAIVEALVPEECFRYERDPSLESRLAARIFINERGRKAHKRQQPRKGQRSTGLSKSEEQQHLSKCRNEVNISEEDDKACGAKCGTGEYNGFALYPQRFSVNITSHIEWYLSRGVDIKVILSMRDRNISSKGKLKSHCHLVDVGRREDEVALSLMTEAIEKYGHGGTLTEDESRKERVITVSYEGLMTMKESYLFSLYKELGINSTYHPLFVDGNEKYTTEANANNLGVAEQMQKLNAPKPQEYELPPLEELLLVKKLITVVDSTFLSTTLAAAAGTFSSDWPIQHVALPQGQKCSLLNSNSDIVEALAPEDKYPTRYFVNITSHIEYYLALGIDIQVVVVMRDHSISMKERLRNDCPEVGVAEKEDEVALSIIKEAYTKYGKHGSMLKRGEKQRVIAVSYEGLLELKDSYLFDIYHQLGINSTYVPTFDDENAKYVATPEEKAAFKGHGELRHRKKAKPLHFLPGGG